MKRRITKVDEEWFMAGGQIYEKLRTKYGIVDYSCKDEIIAAYCQLSTDLQVELNQATALKKKMKPLSEKEGEIEDEHSNPERQV